MNNNLNQAKRCLTGLSIGDAFGESFFGEPDLIASALAQRTVPQSTWDFTDDTIMAIAVYAELAEDGQIHPDRLAQRLASNYARDPRRGYGGTAHSIFRQIGEGRHWQDVAGEAFDGMGSMGNGAAVRSGPIGAFCGGIADSGNLMDITSQGTNQLIHMATAAAQVTHSHPDGIAGAVAIAVATALATQIGIEHRTQSDPRVRTQNSTVPASITPSAFIETVARLTPESDTKYKIAKAATLGPATHPETLKVILGNGSRILAQDTVPFAVWCAAHHLWDYEAALWKAVSVLGDRDTICAMVGGIVVMSADERTVPQEWQSAVERWEGTGF